MRVGGHRSFRRSQPRLRTTSLNLAGYLGDDARSVRATGRSSPTCSDLPADRLALMARGPRAGRGVGRRPGRRPRSVMRSSRRSPTWRSSRWARTASRWRSSGSDGRTIAVAHCGWRGLAADVVGVLVVGDARPRARRFGRLMLGPAVCGRCYPVPPERVGQLGGPHLARGGRAPPSCVCADGQPGIDVRAGVRRPAGRAGRRCPASIVTVGGCTIEDPVAVLLPSRRADGTTGARRLHVGSDRALGPAAQWRHDDAEQRQGRADR